LCEHFASVRAPQVCQVLPNKLNGMQQHAVDNAAHCMQWSQLVVKLGYNRGEWLWGSQACSNAWAYLVAQQAIVNKDTVQAVPQDLVHQRCCYSAVHTSGQGADDVILRPNLGSIPATGRLMHSSAGKRRLTCELIHMVMVHMSTVARAQSEQAAIHTCERSSC